MEFSCEANKGLSDVQELSQIQITGSEITGAGVDKQGIQFKMKAKIQDNGDFNLDIEYNNKGTMMNKTARGKSTQNQSLVGHWSFASPTLGFQRQGDFILRVFLTSLIIYVESYRQ